MSIFFCHLWKDNILYCVCLCHFVKISWLYLCGSTSGLSALFHWSLRLLFWQCHASLVAKSKSWHWVISVFQLHSSPSILCWLFWVFCLFMQSLEVVCWYPQNNLLGIDRAHTESLNQVGKNTYPNNFESSYPLDTFFWIPVNLPYCDSASMHSTNYELQIFIKIFFRKFQKEKLEFEACQQLFA